jgi:D-3-phosphoglycerate dehydrogenase
MAAVQMKEFLEKGNIKNSVNFPNVILDDEGERISVIHKAELNTNDILSVFTEKGVTVKAFKSGTKGEYTYSLFVVDGLNEGIEEKILGKTGVVRVRKI